MQNSYGVTLISKERARQVEEEGWTIRHDNQHVSKELAMAGACYAFDYAGNGKGILPSTDWPWHEDWWKPTPNNPIKQLVKAGALIAAEIDRLHRFDQLVKRAEKAPKGSFLNP